MRKLLRFFTSFRMTKYQDMTGVIVIYDPSHCFFRGNGYMMNLYKTRLLVEGLSNEKNDKGYIGTSNGYSKS